MVSAQLDLKELLANPTRLQPSDDNGITFVIAKSREVVSQLAPAEYDFALIDGNHGFATLYIDFCYATVALNS
jgi:hypothetical protein